MATADLTYFPDDVLVGAIRRLVTSTATQPGDSGIDGRLGKYDFPLLELTVSPLPEQSQEVEDLFFTQNGPERSFLVRPPLVRDRVATAQPLLLNRAPAFGTGTAAVYQLGIAKTARDADGGALHTVYKPIYHPLALAMVIYANGVALATSPALWTLGALGSITVTAPLGHALTADFDYDTAMFFVADQIETTLQASEVEFVKGITIREAPGE
ncbi:DUF2460 domain-containing protein [Bradyrhizobium sp. URHD0069]|uniref:DUF2460 domain-containing protein n=1 Tax=Bradyrhizobium sp. URHD0069 TaxID=1380355 RepID=UPI0004962DDA|nr:DUF2460 domain-containing protein [Bradyrhizobium sp. URHD0069]